jgi:hypothetical protein
MIVSQAASTSPRAASNPVADVDQYGRADRKRPVGDRVLLEYAG